MSSSIRNEQLKQKLVKEIHYSSYTKYNFFLESQSISGWKRPIKNFESKSLLLRRVDYLFQRKSLVLSSVNLTLRGTTEHKTLYKQ